MRIIDEQTGERWMVAAADVAKKATCGRSKCGSVIVKDGEVIGEGWNSPAGNLKSQRRCDVEKSSYHTKVTDKTCCVHAEERAIMDALRRHPDEVPGSTLYFIRLDEDDKPKFSGRPYCTICSKLALDAGIAEFVLWHEEGITAYPTDEYNDLSYKFFDGQEKVIRMEKDRLEKLLEFTRMLNAFRLVERMMYANGTDRMENDTEHSYNLAMLAWYIVDSSKLDLDRDRVVRYALVHDLAEVYAGDTYIYSDDTAHLESKAKREKAAIDRLGVEFSDFPDMHVAIHRYESRKDRESRFVYALDKIQPVLQALLDDGRIWREKGISIEMLHEHKKDKVALSPEIGPYFDELIGFLKENENRLFGGK